MRDDRPARINALWRSLQDIPTRPERWKDAIGQLESLAPEGSLVPDLCALFLALPRGERWMAISLLGETRHADAWPTLERLLLDPATDWNDRQWASRAAAKVGGDAGHATLVQWLRAPKEGEVFASVLDAVVSFNRIEGAEVLRELFERGRLTALDAGVKIAVMTFPTERVAAWWNEGTPSARGLALEIAITRAGPVRPQPLPATLRDWAQSLLDASPRPLTRYERARLERWIAEG